MFFILAIGIKIIYSNTNSFTDFEIVNDNIQQNLLFLLIFIVMFYFFYQAKTVEFDNEYMFVSSRKGVEKIQLKDVFKIKLTLSRIQYAYFWKISYKNNDGIHKSVRILPINKSNVFNEFIDVVRKKNSNLITKHWSHSFDFDQ